MCYGHCLLVRLSRCVLISCGSAMFTFVYVSAIHLVVREHAQAGVISNDWLGILSNPCSFLLYEVSAAYSWVMLATSATQFSVRIVSFGVT